MENLQPIALCFYAGYHPAWCSLQAYSGNVFSSTLQCTQQTVLTKELTEDLEGSYSSLV